jgi:dethiobiotin synthetase
MIPLFITGTGTGVGKTLISVMVSNALEADYWKPVQAGNEGGTDTETVAALLDKGRRCIPEMYNLSMGASPHIAARHDGTRISVNAIARQFETLKNNQPHSRYLVIEGAGGLLVPLNEQDFVVDLIIRLQAKVIIVSKNYLGSINHSLLTAQVCKLRGLQVIGWIFNDDYLQYQEEIATWSGFPVIGSVPRLQPVNFDNVSRYGLLFKRRLLELLEPGTL